jgi:hypothetical protein
MQNILDDKDRSKLIWDEKERCRLVRMPRTDADFWGMTTTNTIKVVWA